MARVRNKNIYIFLFIPFIGLFLAFQSIVVPVSNNIVVPDSLTSAKYMSGLVKYQNYYPFVRYDKNFIEWTHISAVDSFFTKLSLTPKRKLKILQIGDSHLQADFPSGYIRERMQQLFGYGGRGLIFPYKSAGTHSAYDYKTYSYGRWDYTRNTQREAVYDMGLIGATIHTTDSTAGFKIVFHEGFIRDNFTQIKLYCKLDSLSFDVKVKTSSGSIPLYLSCHDYTSDKPYILISLPRPSDTIEVMVNKTDKKQKFFECYGLMVESGTDNGVLYCSTGINGAGYRSLLKQRIFEKQLAEFKPDLIIIDMGANDFYAGAFNAVEMENNLVKIIDMIQRSSPSTAILISNSQDIFYRHRRSIPQCKDFMEMTRRVAAYRKCAFYDYYDIAGGGGSMAQWYKRGLSKPDKIHLTTQGYYTRGELYLNAMLNSYAAWLLKKEDSLVADRHAFDTLQLKKFFVEDISFKKENAKTEFVQVYREPETDHGISDNNDRIYYIIRSGDNLGAIAERYHVSVKDLQYWNALSGNRIIAGETLVIYKKSHITPTPVQNNATTKVQPTNTTAITPNNRVNNRKAVYKVASGDSLWTIAQKYKTTVENLKKTNNLKSDKLSVGQTLIIP
ncbi:MAG: LysM peptidoglycan-binding domain-containing protein [Bacteroidota bacterium]